MRVVLANGCFDLLHMGHIAHLREAKRMGDFLVVGLTMDEHVGKPGRPIQTFEERAEILRELRCVAAVSACRNAVEAILKWKPFIFVKGGDYAEKGLLLEEVKACAEVGAKIAHTNYVPVTTTDIVKRIRESACA